jgi:hypothetical protein
LNNNPYLGVCPFFLIALKRAFSAPKIYIVDDGNLARLLNPPDYVSNLAPILSPKIEVRFGATLYI